MGARAIARISHPVVFLAAAAGVYVASILIVGLLPRLQNADALAVGVTCDLVLLVPALYYLVLVRGRGWRSIGVVPVFLVGLLAASWILPADRQRLLSVFEWAAVPLELGLVSYIGWRAVVSVRRIRSRTREASADAFTAIRDAAREVTGSRWAAEALAQEIATFYYTLFTWRTPLPERSQGFTSYRKNSYGVFLAAIVLVLVIETVAVHLLIATLWSTVVAWIATALSLYALLWMIGDWQALRLRTTEVTPDRIDVRLGTRWEVAIPRESVVAVHPARQESGRVRDAKPLNLVLLGEPDVEIRLSQPVTARGMYGLRRTSKTIRLQFDEPERFLAQVRPDPGS